MEAGVFADKIQSEKSTPDNPVTPKTPREQISPAALKQLTTRTILTPKQELYRTPSPHIKRTVKEEFVDTPKLNKEKNKENILKDPVFNSIPGIE